MSKTGFSTREEAVVDRVFVGREDCGFHTVSIALQSGFILQNFGGLVLDDHGPLMTSYLTDLYAVFNVPDYKTIKGKKCFVLRSFTSWNAQIEGVEVGARRFTLTRWRRKHVPDVQTPLERVRESLKQDIEHSRRQIQSAKDYLVRLDVEYVEWD